jgi:hypothetical protein
MQNTDAIADGFKRIERQLEADRKRFAPISIEEKQKRLALIENGMKWGMTVEQIARYTQTQGTPVHTRKVYDYLGGRKAAVRARQHLHDYMVFESFLMLGNGFSSVGKHPAVVQFNKTPGDLARFRYDFKFRIDKFLFYGEVQLSDLAGTNWRKKHKQYVSFYEKASFPFRTLWIIDQQRDLSVVRSHARATLMSHSELTLFYYTTLESLHACKNPATDLIWITERGKKTSLV